MSSRHFICTECRQLLRRGTRASDPLRQSRRSLTTTQAPRAQVPGLRLAIVGSGPAGFYAAARVLRKLDDARVDMYERLPVPFGLVRYGVAPDHPEVKNCQDRFEQVAQSDRFQFVGNTTVGRDVTLAAMRRHYDALLFAYGASEDRLLGVPGEDLGGVHSAREFVGWYNGLPEFADSTPDLSGERAIVVGNGNVALDVARVLLTDVDELRKTDMSDRALDALSRSRVKSVTVAGRRGPMQAAFTIKELRELVQLPNSSFSINDAGLLPSRDYIKSLPKLQQRKYRFVDLLRQQHESRDGECHLLSMVSPVEFTGRDGHLSGLNLEQNTFTGDEKMFEPSARVKGTGKTTHVDADLAFRSIGYRSLPLPDMDTSLGIDFEKRQGIIQNDGLGRALSLKDLVQGAENPMAKGIQRGCYCSGWVKNGPTGVIASTMDDAFTTADAIITDWEANEHFLNGKPRSRDPGHASGWQGVRTETPQQHQVVSWADWRAIDAVEKSRVEAGSGRPRSKLLDVADMLSATHA